VQLQERPIGTHAAGLYRRVLLVEDEVTFRRVIARNLSGRGVQVREVGTAAEAVDVATADRPDLMLLDINLPDRSGWDVMRELRRLGINVPTIVVSAVRVSQSRLEEFRPMAYLTKPFPLEALLRLVFKAPVDEPEESSEGPLAVAASMLSAAAVHEMTATTVVGVLGRDDVDAFRALVRDVSDEYGLEARVKLHVGSYSVRFSRRSGDL
jgi:CheY-like chemotaxis protein